MLEATLPQIARAIPPTPFSPTAMRPKTDVDLLGRSAAMIALQDEIERVARSDAKVLITGESGVGKEVVARTLHRRGRRGAMPFIAVNCAGLSETLLESELFGHVRGSFTGAYRDKPGKLEAAHMGTAFLDEIGQMTLHMQALLLRFLETGELQKVGADGGGRHFDVRVIAATNSNLFEMISQGAFREDLFYRLNVIHIVVPPLRERIDDIPLLVHHFLDGFAAANHVAALAVSPDVMRMLQAYPWPGNVRQLENVIERMIVNARGAIIGPDDLPPEIRGDRIAQRPTRERRHAVADELFERLVEQHESFWVAVYPLFMSRQITCDHVREVVRRGLQESRGNYKIVTRLFNMDAGDYKRFLNFLRMHDCHVRYQEYR